MFTHIKSKYFIEENLLDLGDSRLYFPKIMLSNTNKFRLFSLQQSREDRLINSSKQELEFCNYFTGFIREVPFPILNLKLWNRLLDFYRISKDDKERRRNIHQIDFLFPLASLIIELDSEYHKRRRILDQVRDQYLKLEYGLTVLRNENNMDFINRLDEINQLISVYNPMQTINLQHLSDQYFEAKFRVLLTSFEILISSRPDWNIPRLKGIILTREDLKDLMITDQEFPKINEWSTKYCGKKLIKINVSGKSKDIINSYRNGELDSSTKLYQILQNLGY